MSRDNDKVSRQPKKRPFIFEWELLILRSNLPQSIKLTALTLKTFANGDGEEIFPTITTIAELRHVDKSTVRRHRDVLEGRGWIEIQSGQGQPVRGGWTDRIHLQIPESVLTQMRTPFLESARTQMRTPFLESARTQMRTPTGKCAQTVKKCAHLDASEVCAPRCATDQTSTTHINHSAGGALSPLEASAPRRGKMSRAEWMSRQVDVKEEAL